MQHIFYDCGYTVREFHYVRRSGDGMVEVVLEDNYHVTYCGEELIDEINLNTDTAKGIFKWVMDRRKSFILTTTTV